MAINQVPQAGQTLAVTQNPILQNFINIDAQYGIDHVPFNTAGAGWHNQVTFVSQGTPPVPVAPNLILYNALNVAGTAQALFFRNNAGPAIDFTSSTQANPGYFRTPSGLLIKWGSGTVTGNNFVVFPGGMPAFTAPPYTVQLTITNVGLPGGTSASIYYDTVNTTAANLYVNIVNFLGVATTASFRFLAIGLG